MREFNYGENATIKTVTFCHQFKMGTICTLVTINNFFDTFENKETKHLSKKVTTLRIEANLHTVTPLNMGYSVVKDYLTTANNVFIYNNMSCKELLDNWRLGESRG